MINDPKSKQSAASTIGKQQLLVKWQLCQQNALIARQQLAVKAGLAQKHTQMQLAR